MFGALKALFTTSLVYPITCTFTQALFLYLSTLSNRHAHTHTPMDTSGATWDSVSPEPQPSIDLKSISVTPGTFL